MNLLTAHLLYAFVWLIFGLFHSLLARDRVKSCLSFIPVSHYRLVYNLFAVTHTLIVLALGYWLYADYGSFEQPVVVVFIRFACLLSGVIVLLIALRHYDLGLFSGTRQWRARYHTEPIDDHEDVLNLTGIHSIVRHPLYSGSFLLLWGIAGSWFGLMTALFGSAYLLVGTHFEEKNLIRQFGDSYRQYKQDVPAYIPRLSHFRHKNSP